MSAKFGDTLWTPRVIEARDFAIRAHGDQKRIGGAPYIEHLEEVTVLVAGVTSDEDMLCAALLHDVLEDTPYGSVDLFKTFNQRTVKLIQELTDKYTKSAYPNLNRLERKTLECARMSTISHEAQTIKYADLISNTWSISKFDWGFAKIYLQEKFRILVNMRNGDPLLYAHAWTALRDANRALGVIPKDVVKEGLFRAGYTPPRSV